MPAAICRATTSATALAVSASNAAASAAPPCSRARTRSTSGFGRGRLPVWVVRMRSLLVFTRSSSAAAAVQADRSRSYRPSPQPDSRLTLRRQADMSGVDRQCGGRRKPATDREWDVNGKGREIVLGHNRRMSGAECLADMLKGYGVTHVFHVPAVLRKTMAVMEGRTDIKRLHVHGEKAAAYMADGYARASGKPGICAAQVIGALNLAAGLRDAWLAHSPVIAMTGGRDPKTKFRKVYQEIDDVPAFEPVTKFNATVDDVARVPDMVRQAFRVATSGTPGPVHLQFRGNEGQVDADEAEMEPLCEPQFARVPPYRPMPDDASVMAALKHLQESQRPVIVAGGGVRASGASAELVALAQALQIPVATSLNGKDAIPGNHPLSVGVVGTYSRESANRVVNGADLVCFIGTEAGGMTTHFWAVPKIGTPAIQIDIDPEAIGRNYPLVAGVNGDAKVTLARMLATADRASADKRKAWVEAAQKICKEWSAKYQSALTSRSEERR